MCRVSRSYPRSIPPDSVHSKLSSPARSSSDEAMMLQDIKGMHVNGIDCIDWPAACTSVTAFDAVEPRTTLSYMLSTSG